MRIHAEEIKTALLGYFRFARQMPYVCTEYQGYLSQADVFAATKEYSVEAEVKISWRDFLADFEKNKHYVLEHAPEKWPNKFYYCAPTKLAEEVFKHIEENKMPFGVISYDRSLEKWVPENKPWERLLVVRRAPWIHKNPPSGKLLESLVLRMGSELFGHHLVQHLHYGLTQVVKDINAKAFSESIAEKED